MISSWRTYASTHSGLVVCFGHNDYIVARCLEQPVCFTEVGSTESIFVRRMSMRKLIGYKLPKAVIIAEQDVNRTNCRGKGHSCKSDGQSTDRKHDE